MKKTCIKFASCKKLAYIYIIKGTILITLKNNTMTNLMKMTKEEAKVIISTPNAEFNNTKHNSKMVANELRSFIASLHGQKPHLV